MPSVREVIAQDYCERCGGDLTARSGSWSKNEIICTNCVLWEELIINTVDESKSELEGCGYIPDVDFEINWGERPPDA